MIYTFANRTVGLVGQFETPIELMRLAIFYLGGNCFVVDNAIVLPDVIIIGAKTRSEVIDDIQKHFINKEMASIFVYEAKINDHMPDDKLFSDILDRVKEELPWSKAY